MDQSLAVAVNSIDVVEAQFKPFLDELSRARRPDRTQLLLELAEPLLRDRHLKFLVFHVRH